jgi:hypothetical protein
VKSAASRYWKKNGLAIRSLLPNDLPLPNHVAVGVETVDPGVIASMLDLKVARTLLVCFRGVGEECRLALLEEERSRDQVAFAQRHCRLWIM